MSDQPQDTAADRRRSRASLLLLLIPVIALIFPGIYNRETPTLFGFPFFYWYQLAWVVLATVVLGIVYKLRKRSMKPSERAKGSQFPRDVSTPRKTRPAEGPRSAGHASRKK